MSRMSPALICPYMPAGSEAAEVTVELPDGQHAELRCLARDDGGMVPYDDVVQAAASQLATERYTEELQRRMR